MSISTLDASRELAFNYLRKTNRLLIINDKDDSFFHNFNNKYKVCNTLLVGSDYEDIPWRAGYSVTNLGYTLKYAHDDGSLNTPVDVLYLDMTSQVLLEDYLVDTIDENTLIIVKIKNPVEALVPSILKKDKDILFQFGDWGKPHKHDSQYYLALI